MVIGRSEERDLEEEEGRKLRAATTSSTTWEQRLPLLGDSQLINSNEITPGAVQTAPVKREERDR